VYNIKHLVRIARSGFDDMAPALRRAFNRDPSDDRLDQLFGAAPRTVIAGSIAAAIVIGAAVEAWLGRSLLTGHINFAAVLIGAAMAQTPEAREKRLRREASKQGKREKRRNKRARGRADS